MKPLRAPSPGEVSVASTLGPEVSVRSINALYGKKLGASDGDVGQVRDFYFDDEAWAIRYVVVDTGGWLGGRSVLIAPQAFGELYQDGHCLLVDLTRQQIADSPSIDAHKPVSRQYEEAYFRHYGWPQYWDGAADFGLGTLPMAPPPPDILPWLERGDERARGASEDSHLRSTVALRDYHIQTPDGMIGHVADFMIDGKSWNICHLIVETGHWYHGKRIVISPAHVRNICCEDAAITVDVTKESILQAPEYHVPPLGAAYHDTRDVDLV